MATGYSQILKVSIALAIVLLVTLLFPTFILPLLPPLRPLASQLLVRLRDVLAFLAFTTAIAAGIFSTQRKDVQSNKRKKPFLEHHALGSIFGEPGHGETDHLHSADEDEHIFSLATKKTEMSNGGHSSDDVMDYSIDRASSAMVNGSLLQKRSTRLAMEASRERKLPISKEDHGIIAEPKVQKKLHRKSSSLDDSVNYEPEVEAARAIMTDTTPSTSTPAKNKPSKRVSFSVTSPPSSSKSESQDENTKQSTEDTTEKPRDVNTMSPGDLTRQADAFIAKFKEQMRMQRLESFQRYRRRVV